MKPTKAYILKIDDPVSHEYAKICAESCDKIGLAWEYFLGYKNLSSYEAWCNTGIIDPDSNDIDVSKMRMKSHGNAASSTSAGHAALWKKISEGNDECAIVLEHDSIMLHPVDVNIPDNQIVVLGYKLYKPDDYDHISAGAPVEVLSCERHEGAHAYAITKQTATTLVNEIKAKGGPFGIIDNHYFTRHWKRRNPKQPGTTVPLGIVNPTAAIGWLRKSTIWDKSAELNFKFLDSFAKNYKGKKK
jgi:hypothetical protein